MQYGWGPYPLRSLETLPFDNIALVPSTAVSLPWLEGQIGRSNWANSYWSHKSPADLRGLAYFARVTTTPWDKLMALNLKVVVIFTVVTCLWMSLAVGNFQHTVQLTCQTQPGPTEASPVRTDWCQKKKFQCREQEGELITKHKCFSWLSLSNWEKIKWI